MTIILWLFNIAGIFGCLLCLFLYNVVTPIVYEESKENIFLHLEGNTQVFDQFFDVCMTRGVLKLDFIANLEFFTILAFIMLNN
jgi:hypothetical protein